MRAEPLVTAGDHHRLKGPLDREQRAHDVRQPAERALRARHRDHRRAVGGQLPGLARGGGVDRPRELGAHRHARHHHPVGGDPARHELVPDLLGGHAVAVHRAGHPLAVGHEVRHRGGVGRHRAAGGGERGHHRGRGGVHGHHRVRSHRVEQPAQAGQAQARHPEGERRLRTQPIPQTVGEGPHRGGVPQQPVVRRAARPREERMHERVEVIHHHWLGAARGEGARQAARGLRVAGSVAGGEDEDAHVRARSARPRTRCNAAGGRPPRWPDPRRGSRTDRGSPRAGRRRG